jgi:Ca-activated chloride channel family protein
MKRIFSFLVFCFLVQMVFAQGLIVVLPDERILPPTPRPRPMPPAPNPMYYPLETRSVQIQGQITDYGASTSFDQVFYNPTGSRLEGYFMFPLPNDATIEKFSMYINGKETAAELLDATKARTIYEDIVRRSKDPALLEFYDRRMIRVRIFPIEPYAEQRVKLTYGQSLARDNGNIVYELPMSTGRYQQAKAIPSVSMKLDVQTTEELKNIGCATHKVEIQRKGDRAAVVGFEMKEYVPSMDFQLNFSTANAKLGCAVLTHKQANDDGYFMMSLSPGYSVRAANMPKDVTFVVDCSGSMTDGKMEQAIKSLKFCVENLNDTDCFNIVRFSTEANALFGTTEPANAANRARAKEFIEGFRPIGGTNIDEALQLALQSRGKQGGNSDRPYFVIFMTDGKPTIGETDETALLNRVKNYNTTNTRIFTIGIGTELNIHLLDKLTEMTKAYRTYILPNEDIEVKVSDFYTKVASPIMTDIKLSVQGIRVSDLYPKELPDLFLGSSVSVLGRYNGSGNATVVVEGKVNGKTERLEYAVTAPKEDAKNTYIPALWATRYIGHLLDQIRLKGENQELVDEVVRLSKKYGIITPYTSYLIIEDERNSWSRPVPPPGSPRPVPMEESSMILNSQSATAPAAQSIRERGLGMTEKEGKKGVDASKDVQQMNQAENIEDTRIRQEELSYNDANGNSTNVGEQVQQRGGRTFYFSNNQWIDTKATADKKVRRIQFNSTAYFDLLRANSQVTPYLANGTNIRFELNNEVIEIYE